MTKLSPPDKVIWKTGSTAITQGKQAGDFESDLILSRWHHAFTLRCKHHVTSARALRLHLEDSFASRKQTNSIQEAMERKCYLAVVTTKMLTLSAAPKPSAIPFSLTKLRPPPLSRRRQTAVPKPSSSTGILSATSEGGQLPMLRTLFRSCDVMVASLDLFSYEGVCVEIAAFAA